MSFPTDSRVIYGVIGIVIALAAGTIVRLLFVRNANPETARSRLASLKTWWILALLLSVSVQFEVAGAAVLMAVAGVLGFREFIRLIGVNAVGRATVACAFGLIPVHYGLIVGGCDSVARGMLPVATVMIVGGLRACRGQVEGYTRLTAATVWGLLLLVYAPSYSLFLFRLSDAANTPVGPAGWFLYLVILTEANDIAQAIIGRSLGRTKMTPVVSPNKSWEGFVGGLATTTVLAIELAPWLKTIRNTGNTATGSTAAGVLTSAAAGGLIAVSGFLGDINMSAVKRDAGVKDGGALLPGHGGVIDRIDSLSFSAPVFYCFVLAVSV